VNLKLAPSFADISLTRSAPLITWETPLRFGTWPTTEAMNWWIELYVWFGTIVPSTYRWLAESLWFGIAN